MQSLCQDLQDKLVCPTCKGDLQVGVDQLSCLKCQLAFLVKDGIPVMLVEEAKKLN